MSQKHAHKLPWTVVDLRFTDNLTINNTDSMHTSCKLQIMYRIIFSNYSYIIRQAIQDKGA